MYKILIVEDEALAARMSERIATEEGFDVKIANDGKMAIEIAKEWKPDIILMDIMMPQMNGFQALENLKSDSETKEIPVVMLTNMSGKHDEDLAISKGAAAFWVKKDLKPKMFKQSILSILEK